LTEPSRAGAVKRAGLYARVSTTDQPGGLAVQLEQLRRYAEARRFEIVECIDEGLSGKRRDRPGLDMLLAAARRRMIDVVICTKLDRLFRNVRHMTAIAEELRILGVDLVVLDQQIDTTTTVGRLTFHVLAAVGEFEGDLIRERVRAGVQHAMALRRRWGRPAEHSVDLVRAQTLLAGGASVRAVARELGLYPIQVRRALKRAEQNPTQRSPAKPAK
jgi:DNA invertase Pin-like site-specific DNA recombinase